MEIESPILNANSVYLNQTPRSAASDNQTPRSTAPDLGLHCLPIILLEFHDFNRMNYYPSSFEFTKFDFKDVCNKTK